MKMLKYFLFVLILFVQSNLANTADSNTGILLLAHGGKPYWNAQVEAIGSRIKQHYPVEIAFGMANPASIRTAIEKLQQQKVTEIVAVPLFVSSHSSVIRSTEYLLGMRKEKPPEADLFASMDHSHLGTHSEAANKVAAEPLNLPVNIKMTEALNAHPIVSDILLDRSLLLSRLQVEETVILVAHGPVEDDDNRLWLADMERVANYIREHSSFAEVLTITVRDDADEKVWNQAKEEFRRLVQNAKGKRVLIVPHLLSFGGIEEGVRKRLEGLQYEMINQGILPDGRIAEWVLDQVQGDQSLAKVK